MNYAQVTSQKTSFIATKTSNRYNELDLDRMQWTCTILAIYLYIRGGDQVRVREVSIISFLQYYFIIMFCYSSLDLTYLHFVGVFQITEKQQAIITFLIKINFLLRKMGKKTTALAPFLWQIFCEIISFAASKGHILFIIYQNLHNFFISIPSISLSSFQDNWFDTTNPEKKQKTNEGNIEQIKIGYMKIKKIYMKGCPLFNTLLFTPKLLALLKKLPILVKRPKCFSNHS